jgi:hypothetical protein
MFWYSVENPIAGATIAYMGRKAMVKIKEPGIAGFGTGSVNKR